MSGESYSSGTLVFDSENQSIIGASSSTLVGSDEAVIDFYKYKRIDAFDGSYSKTGIDLRGFVDGKFGFGIEYGLDGFAVDTNVQTMANATLPEGFSVEYGDAVSLVGSEDLQSSSFDTTNFDVYFAISLITELEFYFRYYAGFFGAITKGSVRESFAEETDLFRFDSDGLTLFEALSFSDPDGEDALTVDLEYVLDQVVPPDPKDIDSQESPFIVSVNGEQVFGPDTNATTDLASIGFDLSGGSVNASGTGSTISDKETDKIVDVDVSMLGFLPMLGLPPTQATFSLGSLGTVEINLLQLEVGPIINLVRDLSYSPELGVTLDFSAPVEIEGKEVTQWDGAWAEVPEFFLTEDVTTVTPTFRQIGKFDTDLDLALGLEMTLTALEAEYKGKIGDLGFGPFLNKTFSEDFGFDVYDSAFTLGGFNEIDGQAFTLVTPDSTINPGLHDDVNVAPVAYDDTLEVDENYAVTMSDRELFGNDYDPDAFDTFTVSVYALDGTLGTVSETEYSVGSSATDGYSDEVAGALGTFTYDPTVAFAFLAEGETATDTFGYTITDAAGASDTGTVTVTIEGRSSPVDDYFVTGLGDIVEGDLFADNGDGAEPPEFEVISAVNGSAAAVGATITLDSGALVTVNADATFTYDPNDQDHLAGSFDSFTYTSINQNAVVTIEIEDRTDPELQAGQSFDVFENRVSQTIIGTVAASDNVGVTGFAILGGNSDGYFDIDNDGNLSLRLAGLIGAVNDYEDGDNSFTITVAAYDAAGLSGTGDVVINTLDVAAAANDSFVLDEGETHSGDLTADNGNGTDAAGLDGVAMINGVLLQSGETQELASGALLTVFSDGTFDYDPNGAVFAGESDGFTYTAWAQEGFAPRMDVDLAELDGSFGRSFQGLSDADALGSAIALVDVNGDGLDDVLIGADNVDDAGAVYVVYGAKGGIDPDLTLADLDGDTGFVLNGLTVGDDFGDAIANLGDVNGDGINDFAIGAHYRDVHTWNAGETYVIYGSTSGFGANFDVDTLDGSNGFRLEGALPNDHSGWHLSSAGDINSDGYDDILVGAVFADPAESKSGSAYLIFGGEPQTQAVIGLADLDGTNGFRMDGDTKSGYLGNPAAVGDVNGDGHDDFIIGARGQMSSVTGQRTGEAYIVYGKTTGFAADMVLPGIAAEDGVAISGVGKYDQLAASVAGAGDVNGDGLADFVMGARHADLNGTSSGQSYLVLGATDFGATLDLSGLDGSDGFRMDGANAGDLSGAQVGGIGDWNGDGYDDILVAAPFAAEEAGTLHLVFGSGDGFDATIDLAAMDIETGFQLTGALAGDKVGSRISVGGDVDGDGLSDFLTSSPSALGGAGEAILVYGRTAPQSDDGWVQIDVPFVGPVSKDDDIEVDADRTHNIDLFADNGFGPDGAPAVFADLVVTSINGEADLVGTEIELDSGALIVVGADGTLALDPVGVYDGLAAGDSVVETFTYTAAAAFSESIELADMDGTIGFGVNGLVADGYLGAAVSGIGDINGDGFADVAIGAPDATGANGSDAGLTYVVFGSNAGFDADIDPGDLDGSNGFVIQGAQAGDSSGFALARLGDVNGDGIDDFGVAAPLASRTLVSSSFKDPEIGATFVIFGSDNGFDAELDLAALSANDGIEITGPEDEGRAGYDISGGGDINGDGIADIVIGAPRGTQKGAGESNTGDTVVLFGGADALSGDVDLRFIDSSQGFTLSGIDKGDRSGWAVETLGDFNGDGIDDFAVGAWAADQTGSLSGETYVVFGFDDTTVETVEAAALDGSNGFTFYGTDSSDRSGRVLGSAGDVNGDGLADLIVGAFAAGPAEGATGEAYVVFGTQSDMSASLSVGYLDGTNGFVIQGAVTGDEAGSSVASAGDFNGDGIDDLIVGVRAADPNGSVSGQAAVIFGTTTGFASALALADMTTDQGVFINGVDAADQAGVAVSGAGDVNGDGVDDVVIGASRVVTEAGATGKGYVVFGRKVGETETATVSLSITGVDDAPTFSLDSDVEMDENTVSIDDLVITDSDGDSFTVIVSGDDAGLVTVGISDSGSAAAFPSPPFGKLPNTQNHALNFVNAPNFEAPEDADADGYYDITVTADDGTNSVSKDLRIKVRDANDFPDAVDDRYQVNADETVYGNLLDEHGLDTDEDGDTLIVLAVGPGQGAVGEPIRLPSGALLTVESNGDFFYDPDGAFDPQEGEPTFRDQITYTVGDGRGGTGIAKLLIAITYDGVELGTDGDDGMDGGPFDSHLDGAAGNDLINGGGGDDTIEGGEGNDRIFGGSWADELYGDAGDDTINGDSDDDMIYGGDGIDRLNGGSGDDAMFGDAGDDWLNGDDGNDKVSGGLGHDDVFGGNGQDVLMGRGGDDVLMGEDGRDRLRGNAGADTLIGGARNDTLHGGDGADVFVFNADHGRWGRDIIRDFEVGTDKVLALGLEADDISWQMPEGGLGAVAFVKGRGKILFEGLTEDQVDSFDDWMFGA